MAALLVFCSEYVEEEEEDLRDDLLLSAMLFAVQAEDLTRELRTITEPVEWRYLRFNSASIQATFSQNFDSGKNI